MPTRKFQVTLPAPPSFNKMYKPFNNSLHKSPLYKKWRLCVRDRILGALGMFSHENYRGRESIQLKPLVITITARISGHRDLDNTIKPVLDALEHYGVFKNDNKIFKIVADKKLRLVQEKETVKVELDLCDSQRPPRPKYGGQSVLPYGNPGRPDGDQNRI